MKYEVGDKVRIKSLDWYNENKNERGLICFDNTNFIPEMSQYCGKILTINQIVEEYKHYLVSECAFSWTDEMIEGLMAEELNKEIERFQNLYDDIMETQKIKSVELITEKVFICPEGYEFRDENGNVINATKIVLEKKSSKTDDIIKWLREHDMTKYIGVIYSGMCSITFDTEKLIKDITEMIGDE